MYFTCATNKLIQPCFLPKFETLNDTLNKDPLHAAPRVFCDTLIGIKVLSSLALVWLCGLWWLTAGYYLSPTHRHPTEASAQEDTADLSESNTCQVSLRSWRHMRYAKPSALTANLRWAVARGTGGQSTANSPLLRQTTLTSSHQSGERQRERVREGGTDVL